MQKPLLDVVILVHSQAGWADLAIRAVENNTRNNHRIIVVQNGQADNPHARAKMDKLLKEVENRGHTVVRLANNRSFSNGMNAGVSAGESPFVVLLNDDAIVTEGWDSAMLQDLTDKTVGMTGARSNYVSGPQGNPAFIGEPPYLIFVCVAFKRKTWESVGPLDEDTFDGFSSEDIDYSWRMKKAGYRLKVSEAFVLHAGSKTLGVTQGDLEARARNDAKYNARLMDKWGKEFALANSKVDTKGVVVTYHAEDWTRVEFLKNLLGLRRSDGVGFIYLQSVRAPIHMARQLACDWAVDNNMDWIVQLDDDATFPNDVLRRLLSHGKEAVTALAYQRKPPHTTCVFEIGDDGVMGRAMDGIEHTGLRKVDCSGFHCSLLHTSVIKKMRAAGIKQYFGGFENKVGEDFAFSLNMKKLGIPLYCDTGLISGHVGASIIVDEAYKRDFQANGGKALGFRHE